MLMEETSVTLSDMREIFLDDDIIISMKRDDEILHTFEVPFPSAGYGGGMLMLSPSERYLVFSYYSGQSEEAYILFEIQNSCLEFIYSSDYLYGEGVSYLFSEHEELLYQALPKSIGPWYHTPLRHQEYYDSSKDPYDPEKYSALSKIYEMAGRELANRQRQGSLRGVTITGTDETDIDEAILSFMALSDEAKACLSKISTHEYKGSKRLELKELASCYHKKLWMSEVSYGGGVWNPDAMDKGCFQLSRDIQKDLYEMGVTGWVAWQGIESLGENLLWNSNWGFIHCLYEEPVWKSDNEDDEAGKENFGMNPRQYCINARHCLTPEDIQKRGYKRGDFFLTKQYYVWGQYTKFIKENDYIIDVSDTNFVAAVSPQGDIVIVVTNEGEDAKEYQIDFPNVGEIISISGTRTSETEKWDVIDEEVHYGMGWIECTAAPRSVSTFQIRRL